MILISLIDLFNVVASQNFMNPFLPHNRFAHQLSVKQRIWKCVSLSLIFSLNYKLTVPTINGKLTNSRDKMTKPLVYRELLFFCYSHHLSVTQTTDMPIARILLTFR